MNEPDLQIGPFTIFVHGRQFPHMTDFWDGNWLNITASVKMPSAQVEVTGMVIRNTELRAFRDGVDMMISTLKGGAKIDCLEPFLGLEMALDHLGHVGVKVSITPDHLNQSHTFHFESDQTYLRPLRSACNKLLETYPVIGA